MMEKLVLVVALALPLGIVLFGLPYLSGSALPLTPAGPGSNLEAPSQRRLVAAETAVPTLAPYSPLDEKVPPTLVPFGFAPGATPTPTPLPAPEAARERVVITNTGGIGAALRNAPAGQQIAALRDGQVLDALERTKAGGREWVRVRTPDGKEGWVTGLATQVVSQTSAPAPPASSPTAAARPGAPTSTPIPTPGATGQTYAIRPGDELRQIAESYGVSAADILAINDIPNPDSLTVGQVLKIPDR